MMPPLFRHSPPSVNRVFSTEENTVACLPGRMGEGAGWMKGGKALAVTGGLTEPLAEGSGFDFQSPGRSEDVKHQVASTASPLHSKMNSEGDAEEGQQNMAMTLTPDVMVACPERPVQGEDVLHKSWSLTLPKLSGCHNSRGSKHQICWGKGTRSTTQKNLQPLSN